MEIEISGLKEAAIRKRHYNLVAATTSWLSGIAGLTFGEYGRANVINYNEMIQKNNDPGFITFFREVPSHLLLFGYALGIGIATYGALHSLNRTSTFNPKKWLTSLPYSFKGFFDALKNKRDYSKTIELARLIEDPILENRVIAEVDFKECRIEDAFKRYDAILNSIPYDSIPRPLIWKIIDAIAEYAVYLLPPNKRKAFQSENRFLGKAFSYFHEGKTQKAKASFEKAIEFEKKYVTEINLLYAYFLELIKDKKAFEQYEKTASLVQLDSATLFESIGESKNIVNIIAGDKYLSKSFVVKRSDQEHLQGERELIEIIEANIIDDKRFAVPRHLGEIVSKAGNYESYMIREKTETILTRMRNNHPDLEKNLDLISEFLSIIYSSVPLAILSPETSDIAQISERLSEINLDNDFILQITDNLEPVLESFKWSPLVYRRDPNPLNWGIKPDGSIVAFDFEPAPAIRLEKDLINLTDMDGLSENTKNRIHLNVISGYNARSPYGTRISMEKSRLARYNGVVLRAFNNYSILSKRKTWRQVLEDLVNNASKAIKNVEKYYPDYFNKPYNRSCYNQLTAALSSLI